MQQVQVMRRMGSAYVEWMGVDTLMYCLMSFMIASVQSTEDRCRVEPEEKSAVMCRAGQDLAALRIARGLERGKCRVANFEAGAFGAARREREVDCLRSTLESRFSRRSKRAPRTGAAR
jgi:hypothetical protein